MIEKETYTKIVTCPHCEGKGYTRLYNDREKGYDHVTCPECEGIHVIKKIVTIQYAKVRDNE